MVFSDTSGKTGIVEDIDFICSTDSTAYPLADKARNVNRHYYKAVTAAIRASGRFQYDDSNLTTLPILSFDLVANQQDYSLPTNLLKVEAVEIKDNGGNWIRLQEVDINDPEFKRTISDIQKTAGTPKYYDINGDSLMLYPAPATGSVTLSSGGKMYVTREVDHFTSADTTQEPGLAEPFHRILSLGASHDYLLVNGPETKGDRVLVEYNSLLNDLIEFYGNRNQDQKVRIRPQHRTTDYL